MEQAHTKGQQSQGNILSAITLDVFKWHDENGIYYIYSPALDLTGYGKTQQYADESFKIVLDDFVDYTHKKNTIYNELERLGWTVNKSKRRVVSPNFEQMLEDNETLRDLYKRDDVHRSSQNASLSL